MGDKSKLCSIRLNNLIKSTQIRWELLKHFDIIESKLLWTFLITSCKLSKDMEPCNDANLKVMCSIPFLNDFGNLMYVTWICTRIDIV